MVNQFLYSFNLNSTIDCSYCLLPIAAQVFKSLLNISFGPSCSKCVRYCLVAPRRQVQKGLVLCNPIQKCIPPPNPNTFLPVCNNRHMVPYPSGEPSGSVENICFEIGILPKSHLFHDESG